MQSTIGNVPTQSRRLRNPQHSFHLRHPPFAIAPFFIAPVLPGETMKNLSFQSRCVSAPIKSSLIGWWNEYYIFYIKHRDLEESSLFQAMVLDPGAVPTTSAYWAVGALDTAGTANVGQGFHSGTGMNWAGACMSVVRREFFRDEGDETDHSYSGFNLAQVSGNSWLDSAYLQTEQAAVDVNVDINADTVIKASEVEQAMRTYEMMVAGGLINMSYEDWLRSYGVRQSEAVVNKPELVRYVREWTYPSSHINPADGKASSACSWSISERADKDRFFSEPGFLYGVTVTRPKVYFSNMKQPGVSLMNDAFSWLPAVLRDDAAASLKKVVDGATDLVGGIASTDFWVDVKDLLIYGDQLVNVPMSTTDAALVGLPAANLEQRYVSSTDIPNLFVTAADAPTGIRMDGIVRLSILGTQTDTTPRSSTYGQVY